MVGGPRACSRAASCLLLRRTVIIPNKNSACRYWPRERNYLTVHHSISGPSTRRDAAQQKDLLCRLAFKFRIERLSRNGILSRLDFSCTKVRCQKEMSLYSGRNICNSWQVKTMFSLFFFYLSYPSTIWLMLVIICDWVIAVPSDILFCFIINAQLDVSVSPESFKIKKSKSKSITLTNVSYLSIYSKACTDGIAIWCKSIFVTQAEKYSTQ